MIVFSENAQKLYRFLAINSKIYNRVTHYDFPNGGLKHNLI